jgi:hypothetical protein
MGGPVSDASLAYLIRPGMALEEWSRFLGDRQPDHQLLCGHGCIAVFRSYVYSDCGLTVSTDESGKVTAVHLELRERHYLPRQP